MKPALGKVLVTAGSVKGSRTAIDYLRNAGCEVVLGTTRSPIDDAQLLEQTREVDGLIFAMEPVSSRLLDHAQRLKVIARPGVGYDTVDLPAATRKGVVVTIAAGTNDQSVADFAFALLLLATRGILQSAQSVQQRGWDRVTGTEVWGKTLAIIGLGRIGQGVAKRALGFDMKVLAVSPRPDLAFAQTHGIAVVQLEQALREADFVSLHAPLTPHTENLINAQALALMKAGAYLVNTSRGGLIDEAALAAAVRSGAIAGAAVDVLRVQGPNSPSPLIGVPGIIVTPHMATFAHEAMERVAMSAARSVVTVLEGQRPPYVVNPEVYVRRAT